MTRDDRLAILTLVVIGVGIPVLLGIASGAILVPHNDDFNYRRVALGLYEDGHVQLTGWTVMSLIGQFALVQPFLWLSGGAAGAFAAMTAVLAVVGIGASYLLARHVLSTRRSFIAVLIVLLFPGFLLNTSSFMTDVPAYAGEIVCLALGAAAIQLGQAHRWRWLVASLAVGWFTFSIREFALAAPAAVLLSASASATDRRRRYVVAGVILLAACWAVYYLTSQLPGQGTASISPFSPTNIERTTLAITTLAFGLSPVLIIGGVWWLGRARRAEILLATFVGLVLFGGSVLAIGTGSGIPTQFVGNMLAQEGAQGSAALAGGRPILFESPWWEAMNLLALVAAILGVPVLGGVVGLAVRRRLVADRSSLRATLGSVTGLLVIFVVIYACGVIVFGLGVSMFDRYLWPLALPLAALLLLEPGWVGGLSARRWTVPAAVSRCAAGIATVILGMSSLVLLLNADAFDAARWRVGEQAVSAGFAAETIDAGMEWVGYHATGTANIHSVARPGEMWYSVWWPSFHQCAIVSASVLEIEGFRLEHPDPTAYRLLLVVGPEEPLYLYRVSNPGCP